MPDVLDCGCVLGELMNLILLLGLLYFVPVAVAGMRGCKAYAGIAVVNIFLGWTLVGWVVALAWAACGETKEAARRAAQMPQIAPEIQQSREPGLGYRMAKAVGEAVRPLTVNDR